MEIVLRRKIMKTVQGTEEEYFKTKFAEVMRNHANSFIQVGYMLRKAQDEGTFRHSEYKTVAEYALKEYGMKKDVVSRYININKRFSEGGYSDRIQEHFENFGYAKLQDMLSLPEEAMDMIPEEVSRQEIQELARETRQENKITDIEVVLEGEKTQTAECNTNLQKVLRQYFETDKEAYLLVHRGFRLFEHEEDLIEAVMDGIAPSGVAVKSVRVQGVGKFILSINGVENKPILLNVRSNEKEECKWSTVIEDIKAICPAKKTAEEEWSDLYGKPFEEEKEKVAPVQQKTEPMEKAMNQPQEKAPETLHDIEETIPEPQPVETPEEPEQIVETEEEEQQLPGQMEVEDYPELIPEKEEVAPVQQPESTESIKPKTEVVRDLSGMKNAANTALSNINVEMGHKAYEAALASAKNLVHCLEVILGEENV